MDAADVRKNIDSGRFKLSSKTDSESDVWKVFAHRRRNRGWRGGGGLTFLFEGAQYARGPLTFEKLRSIFQLKVTPYFQS